MVYDMTIQTATGRCDQVKNAVEHGEFRKAQLEAMADYILYGKDSDGTSAVDRKEIEIKSKNSNFSRKAPVSLDELTESPTFDERTLQPLKKTIYKTIKPSINREEDKDVPGIVELWEVIDKLQYKLDCAQGKIEDPSINLSDLDTYHLRHFLIEVRRQQYYLRDSAKPQLGIKIYNTGPSMPPYILWNDPESKYAVAPLGIKIGNDPVFTNPLSCADAPDYTIGSDKIVLDLCNKDHVYELLENYGALRQQVWDEPQAPIRYILDTLDFYVDEANLSESRIYILERKVDKVTNEIIQKELIQKFELDYNINYISTIWKQEICKKIAEAAQFHKLKWDNRNKPDNWKVCSKCKKNKLRDPHEFTRRARAKDGYSSYCKKCGQK